MKERNEVSDSGHACDVCGLYLAEAGLPRSAMRPPLEIIAGPGPRSKIESPRNDEWVNRWGEETLTVARPHCQLHKSLLITLCSDFAHSPRHSKE
jgi:hypothetical protein